MIAASTQAPDRRAWSAGVAILAATLIAGTLDLAYALIVSAIRGTPPTVILQAIASGLLGKSSFEGGAATAAAGLLLHYGMMACFAAAYFIASRRWPALVERPFLWGPIYGAVVFVVMNYVVVPLSAIGHAFERPPLLFAGELFSHLVFVGLVIALCCARAARPAART
jgi:uncharacterized membrane protein YagU involved in acid resistance